MQGSDKVLLIHYPMFYEAKHRRQCILAVDLPEDVKQDYIAIKRSNPEEDLSFVTAEKIVLSQLLEEKGKLIGHIKSNYSGILIRNVSAEITKVLKDRPLKSHFRDLDYPEKSPFYLYGSNEELNVDHVLLKAPNIQMSGEGIGWEPKSEGSLSDSDLANGMIALATNVYEAAMQPFPSNRELEESTVFFFRPGNSFDVEVYKDPNTPEAEGPGLVDPTKLGNPVATGTITLRDGVFVDGDGPNKDPFPRIEPYSEWKREFDLIGKSIED